MIKAVYDVIIIGAGLAGSAAAIMYAKEGYSVLLLERVKDNTYYKKLCTHFIQPSAIPVIRRLGIEPALTHAGALKNSIAIWSPHGWIRPTIATRADGPYNNFGYNVTREVLDPIIREAAHQQTGVEFKFSHLVNALVFEGDQVVGVEGMDDEKQPFKYLANLVVVADGRNSKLPALAKLGEQKYDNERFVYYAYYKGVKLYAGERSQFWFYGEKSLFAYPLANDVSLLCVFEDKKKRDLWRGNIGPMLESAFVSVPEAPDLSGSTRVSDYLGVVDLTGYIRKAAGKGIAVIGDAALAIDPMAGVGCGWALQSAQWLVDETKKGLRNPAMLNVVLKSYAKKHYAQLSPHAKFIFDAAICRPHNFVENTVFKGAVKDEVVANLLNDFIGRNIPVSTFLSPKNVVRMLYAAFFK